MGDVAAEAAAAGAALDGKIDELGAGMTQRLAAVEADLGGAPLNLNLNLNQRLAAVEADLGGVCVRVCLAMGASTLVWACCARMP